MPEARESIERLIALDPELTLSRLTEIYPVAKYRNLEGLLDGLRRAGLPA